MEPLSFTNEVMHLAAEGATEIHRLSLKPVLDLNKATDELYRLLDTSNTDEAEIARLAWRLRATILLTLLPFGHPLLNLIGAVEKLQKCADRHPAFKSATDSIRSAVSNVMDVPINPKAEHLQKLASADIRGGLAIVTRLTSGLVPGWPAGSQQELAIEFENLIQIETAAQIREETFGAIFVPGGLKYCPQPLATEVVHGCHANRLFVLVYHGEKESLPRRTLLPSTSPFVASEKEHGIRETEIRSARGEVPTTLDEIDNWVEASFWSSVRRINQNNSPHEKSVGARLAIFMDGRGAFLPADGQVIEVSSLMKTSAMQHDSDDVPKKRVEELVPGDLVVLRTAGGGDYVTEVADALIRKSGEKDLRERALEWKKDLRQVIAEQGAQRVAALVRQHGGSVSSPAYLQHWAGEEVMAPRDWQTFRAVLVAVRSLRMPAEQDLSNYTAKKWNEIDRLKSLHQRAGFVIRRALLAKLRELVDSKIHIESSAVVALEDDHGGEMMILRLAGLDPMQTEVPASQLFELEKIRGM